MTRQKNGIWKLTDEEMEMYLIYASIAYEKYKSDGRYEDAKQAINIGSEIEYEKESSRL